MRRQIDTDRVYRVVEYYEIFLQGRMVVKRQVMGPYLKSGAAKGIVTGQVNMYNMWHDPNNPRSVAPGRHPVVPWHNYECYIEISDPLVWTKI